MISRNSDSYFLVCVCGCIMVYPISQNFAGKGICLELVNHQQPYEPRLFTQVEYAVKAGVFESNSYRPAIERHSHIKTKVFFKCIIVNHLEVLPLMNILLGTVPTFWT